jgi:hypothetical protein
MRITIFLYILLLPSISFSQTRKEIRDNRIEKIVSVSKYYRGESIKTKKFDEQGNLISETIFSKTKWDNGIQKTKTIILYFYNDTLIAKSIYKESDILKKERSRIDVVTAYQYEFNKNGLLSIKTELSAETDSTKDFYHYNDKNLLDTSWMYVNDSSNNNFYKNKKNSAIQGYSLVKKNVFTYDSLNRKASEMDLTKRGDKGPFLYKYSYLNDTLFQHDYHYENGKLIKDSSYAKVYSNDTYSIYQSPFQTVEIFTTRNQKGLTIYEETISPQQDGLRKRMKQTSYKYFFRKP